MNGLCITDAVKFFGVTSKTLRYYERVGLLEAKRSENNNYRYYDEAEIERIKQIMILRKMQISIKDIIRIYENDDMSTVVEVFVKRINDLDVEVGALTELKRITNDFLQIMINNGITKISAIPLLYEEMDKQLDKHLDKHLDKQLDKQLNKQLEVYEERKIGHMGEHEAEQQHGQISYKELSNISDAIAKPIESVITLLPPMRVISSLLKENPQTSDINGFWQWIQSNELSFGQPGGHEQFDYQTEFGEVTIRKIPDDFINDGKYLDYFFDGGFFASFNVYLDEDIGERFRALIKSFDKNKYYQIDYRSDGSLRHAAMLEALISPDDQRELVSLLVPVKKRIADSDLFGKPNELSDISVAEIESANPVLWEIDVQLDKLIPVNNPHYQMTEQGEAEYIAWISSNVLSTNTAVKLPFRVDVEFRIRKESMQFAWGADEGNIRLYHGSDLNYYFGINMETNPDERLSNEAICFHQPIFRDYFRYPKRGRIKRNDYNHLTWIVGEKHFAVIINGDVRYCGTRFPYMSIDLKNQEAFPILVGSNGQSKIFFKSIRVSQLVQTQKSKIKEGALTMVTKQSNNVIPNIHRFIVSENGENYHFNGCARYVMECLGEYTPETDNIRDEIYSCKSTLPDLGYWFFAGLTGDIIAQVYSYNDYLGESVSACMFNTEGGGFLEEVFEKCGYASTFVSGKQLFRNKEMYIQTLMAYIDKGVPVIAITHNGSPWGIYVGYEEYGKTLLYLSGDKSEPERIQIEDIIVDGVDLSRNIQASSDEVHVAKGWLFVGEKNRTIDIAQIYRDIICDMLNLLTTKTDEYCFGAEAFRAWAADIENGKFDCVKPKDFDGWGAHISNVCNMATNGSCVMNFTCRAQGLNPDMTFLNENINPLYDRIAKIWNDDNGEDLEALGGGFNVTLEALQDKEKRGKIAAKLREAAGCMDEVVKILDKNLQK